MLQLVYRKGFAFFLATVLWTFLPVWAQEGGEEKKVSATTSPAGQLIEGIAVNHLGGGIAGASVRVESLDAGENDPPLATGTTKGNGDISIRLPRKVDGPVRVRILKKGYAPFIQEIDPSDETEPAWVDATLEGAASLAGTVRDRLFNEPVKGAQVSCNTAGQEFQALTDGQGRYSFSSVNQGPVTVTVTAKGFGIERKLIRVEADQSEADFELGPERRVELRIVTDDEKPAPGVRVEGLVQPGHGYVTVTTEADGKAVLHGIGEDAEELMLRLNGPRYIRMAGFEASVELPQADGQEADGGRPTSMPAVRQEFIVHVAGRVKGRATESKTGDPIVGVRVIAGREFRGDAPMAWTALDGTYELEALPPGVNVLSYQQGSYATMIREVHVDQDQTATVDVKLSEGQPVGGKVVDKAGKPVEQVYISGDNWQGYSTLGLRGISEKDGSFSFPNAPAGEIEFTFVKPGYGEPVSKTLTAGKTDYRIELEVDEAGSSAPVVTRPPKLEIGKPVPDMTLTALDGSTYKLSGLRGKYVLLDCWATWCGPCRKELANVKALHAAMTDRADFVMIGISLDTDRDALKEMMQEEGIVWPQVFGPKSGAREAFEIVNGIGIPYTCLIGPDGTLVAQDLRGEGLAAAVKGAMKVQASKPAK